MAADWGRMSRPNPEWHSERLMRAIEAAPLPANVAALLEVRAQSHPRRAFLVFFDDAEELTYGEVSRLVRRTAAGLTTTGIGPGSRVGLMVHTGRHYPLTWLALASLGAVTVPINDSYTPRELDYTLGDSDASHVVIADDLIPVLEAIEGGSSVPRDHVIVAGGRLAGYPLHWESLVDAAPADFQAPAPPALDALMNIQYTSGTSGMPKGAMQTHRYWLTFGRTGAAQFQDRLRRILIAQPFYYVDAQWLTLMSCWQGATAFVARKMHSSRFLDWLRSYRIQYCNFPEVVSRQPERADRLDDLIVMSCYSHRPENYRMYERRYGGLARQGFSMTELGCALYVPMEAEEMTGTATVGIPVAFREAMVADADGSPVPHGTTGELCIRGAGILEGYFRTPEASADAFHPGGWFRTGDLAYRNEDGWFWYLGRMKDMVRRSGENVSAIEVESVLRGVPEVLEAAVLPVPDEIRGEEVKAYLKLSPDSSGDDSLIERVLAHCSANLAPFKIPRYLELVNEFPRTPSLKIRKSDLIAAKPDLRSGTYDRVKGGWRPSAPAQREDEEEIP